MSYNSYGEYKYSSVEWIGEIPSTWTILKSKFIFDRVNNRSSTGDEELLSVSEYYGVKPRKENIEEGKFLSRAESLIGYKKCSKNDLVMNIMLAWKKGLGVTNYDGIVSPAYEIFKINTKISYPGYINYLLRTDLYASEFKRHSYGVIDSRLRLYPDNFKEIECIIPTLSEQYGIANFLDQQTNKIDTIINKNKELINLLEEKRAALINKVVTKGLNLNINMKDSGINWIGKIPEHWDVVPLTKFLKSTVDYRGKTPEKVDEGVFLVTGKNIKKGNIDYTLSQEFVKEEDYDEIMSRGKPNIGDLLFTTEAPLGEVANIDNPKVALAQRIIKMTGKENILDNYYLKYYMMSSTFQSHLQSLATGSTAKGIKASKLFMLRLLLMPYKEQQDIVQYLDDKTNKIDNIVFKIQEDINLLEEYKTSLIYHTVTGKIDVRGEQ